MRKSFAQHELLDTHELLVFKSVGITKAYTMSTLAKDPSLKTILEEYTKTGQPHLIKMEQLLTGGEHANE